MRQAAATIAETSITVRGDPGRRILMYQAEGMGFEPMRPEGLPVFKTGAISRTPPPLRNGATPLETNVCAIDASAALV